MTRNEKIEEALRIRISQILISEELKKGRIRVPVHLAIGHEWLAVDILEALGPDDKLLLSHRNVAYHLAVSGSLSRVLYEYRGGRFGSMNMIDPEQNIVYTSSILGNQFPVACGVALADKVAGRDATTFVLAGDGSLEEGTFYESLTFAVKHELKVVFIVEDNGWSMSSPIRSRREEIDLCEFSWSIGADAIQRDYRFDRLPMKPFAFQRNYVMPLVCHMQVETYGNKNHHYHHGPIDLDLDPEFPALCELERRLWTREQGQRILAELRKEIA